MADNQKRNDRVLAEGEVTGHAHIALDSTVEIFGEGIEREMVAPNGTEITHEEHGPLTIPAGEWDISRQREIDPDDEEARYVAD